MRLQAELPSLEGMLESLECGKVARLHVRVDGEIRVFLMPQPIDLPCGAQKPARAVHIEYQALPTQSDAAGLVRSLEFK